MADCQRPWRVRMISGAVAIVVAVLLTSCTDHQHSASGHPTGSTSISVPLPTPHTLTRDARTYTARTLAVSGAALVPGHSDQVRLLALNVDSDSPNCAHVSPSFKVVAQTDAAVTLAGFDYSWPAGGSGIAQCLYAGSESSIYRTVVVTFQRPLGTRRLIDAQSGRDIAVFGNQTPPAPRDLPAGYRQSMLQAAGTSTMQPLRQYLGPSNAALEISDVSDSVWAPDEAIVDHAEVGHVSAQISLGHSRRCVSWPIQRAITRDVCAYAGAASQPLATAELLTIARSIP